MTREEMILNELNTAEKRVATAIVKGNKEVASAQDAYIKGMVKMANMLGYCLYVDENKAEWVENGDNGAWANHWSKMIDRR